MKKTLSAGGGHRRQHRDGRGAKALVDHGADAVKVGIGPGSICTTRIVAGVGVPQITAIQNALDGAARRGVPMIADGGVRFSGDVAKAIAAGARRVMMGSLFAGTEESPGEITLPGPLVQELSRHGIARRDAGGHGGSLFPGTEALGDADKLVPEGIEGRVPYKGSVVNVDPPADRRLARGMGYCGCATIEEMRTSAEFVEITSAGMRESHVHDVQIIKEAPNYRVE